MRKTRGDLIVLEARSHLGVVERPWASNRGNPISQWQATADRRHGMAQGTYTGAPWCAIFVGQMYVDAGIEIPAEVAAMLVHPFTGYMYTEAKRRGLILPSKYPVPPGAILTWPTSAGKHTEIVERDLGNGYLNCIGGNVNHGVRETVRRRRDWAIVVVPAIREDAAPATTTRTEYFAIDTNLRPNSPAGPWRSAKSRDRWIAGNWSEQDGAGKLRRYRTYGSRSSWSKAGKLPWFHVEIVPEGGGGNVWKLTKKDGSRWTDKSSRDRYAEAYAKRTGHVVSLESREVVISLADETPTISAPSGPRVSGGSMT